MASFLPEAAQPIILPVTSLSRKSYLYWKWDYYEDMGIIIQRQLIMGNAEQQAQQQAEVNGKKISTHHHCLDIRDRQIILSYRNKIKITIGDVLSFPAGGFEGLHLWDANIVLARYILLNKDIFASKSIIELLSGTGLAAITARKLTSAQHIIATDRCAQAVANIEKNCLKNQVANIQTVCISWAQFSNKQSRIKYNYVIGADLLFKGCPVQLLFYIFNLFLSVGGKVIIIVPNKNGNDSTPQFAQKLDTQMWAFRKEKLVDQIYMDSPLLNQVQGYEEYKEISQGQFYVYVLEKIKEKQKQPPSTLQMGNIEQTNKLKPVQHIAEEDIEIRQQNLEQMGTKQIDIVKIKKSEDRPEYERKKRKTITQIIAESEQPNATTEARKNSQVQTPNEAEVQKQHQLHEQPAKPRPDKTEGIQMKSQQREGEKQNEVK